MTAPNAQNLCPGYKASNVFTQNANRVYADLTLAGAACNVYGFDVQHLSLMVEYQTNERLAVRIFPKYLGAHNASQYILSPDLTPLPGQEKGASMADSDFKFEWSNDPSFQFRVSRKSTGEVIFDTYGHKIVFEDQFLELKTNMVPNYNIYGLGAYIHSFRLGNNYTQTMWNDYNLNNDQVIDANGHSTQPMYLETRYGNGTSTSHGVYARNAHGQDWLLRSDSVTYRTIGGSFDLYFMSGPKPKDVLAQYQTGIVGTPVMQAYWTLGFHQCRWGYLNWTNLQEVIDLYAQAGIQLEGIMNDLDYLYLNRDFTHNANYPVAEGKAFLERLHANGQYWLPILDPNIYVPDPTNASDAYATYNRGKELDIYIKNGTEDYTGILWPGFGNYPDFNDNKTQGFWTGEFKRYMDQLQYDGWWLDVSDATSFCTGACGNNNLSLNPVHVPFPLPGDPNTGLAVDFRYPEKFEVTNATEAASASASLASQSAAYPTNTPTPTPVLPRTLPTPGVRNLNFPPYAINNALPGHSLVKQVIAPNATHNNGQTEYELHNLYGHLSARASYNALVETYGGKRPFFIARSTFAGTGSFAGHWGGDVSTLDAPLDIIMLTFVTDQLQMGKHVLWYLAGTDFWYCWYPLLRCRDLRLQRQCRQGPVHALDAGKRPRLIPRCQTRACHTDIVSQLSAWFPFYRNHNNRNTIAQEAYRWADTAESTRRIMNIRYTLLPYTYTLFHKAHSYGETVLRSLAWEFPDDASLAAIETQFMSGPSILVTPVLAPLATTVQGVFPGVAQGTKWYDWYTLQQVQVAAGENKTLDAPLLHQPIHIRGGSVIPIQKAGNTTKTSRQMPWSLIVALDKNMAAEGDLFLDDGIYLVQNATKDIHVSSSPSSTYADTDLFPTVLLHEQHPYSRYPGQLQRQPAAGQHHHCWRDQSSQVRLCHDWWQDAQQRRCQVEA